MEQPNASIEADSQSSPRFDLDTELRHRAAPPGLAAKMPCSKPRTQAFDFIGGKGGTRTLDPGIMSAVL
jgi:hypothetical protein